MAATCVVGALQWKKPVVVNDLYTVCLSVACVILVILNPSRQSINATCSNTDPTQFGIIGVS